MDIPITFWDFFSGVPTLTIYVLLLWVAMQSFLTGDDAVFFADGSLIGMFASFSAIAHWRGSSYVWNKLMALGLVPPDHHFGHAVFYIHVLLFLTATFGTPLWISYRKGLLRNQRCS